MNTHATDCVFRHLSEMRMKGLRLTEKSVEIAMWFPSILKHALITQEKWISDLYAFIKKNKIHRKSFGQIGVKYLLPDDDFNLFSHNNFLGERVFSGGKTDTLTRLPKSRQNVYEELFLLDSSTSKLLAPEFSYTAPQTSKWPPSFYNLSGIRVRYSGEDSSVEWDGSVTPEEWAVAAYKSGFLWKYQHGKWHTDLNFLYFCGV